MMFEGSIHGQQAGLGAWPQQPFGSSQPLGFSPQSLGSSPPIGFPQSHVGFGQPQTGYPHTQMGFGQQSGLPISQLGQQLGYPPGQLGLPMSSPFAQLGALGSPFYAQQLGAMGSPFGQQLGAPQGPSALPGTWPQQQGFSQHGQIPWGISAAGGPPGQQLAVVPQALLSALVAAYGQLCAQSAAGWPAQSAIGGQMTGAAGRNYAPYQQPAQVG